MWIIVLCVVIVCIAFSPDFRRIGANALGAIGDFVGRILFLAIGLTLIVSVIVTIVNAIGLTP